MALTHRERVRMALAHQETDRVPLDFGGSHETGIQADAYTALLDYLGYEREDLGNWDEGGEATVTPGERVLRRFDIDVRGVDVRMETADARRVIAPNTAEDGWGVIWKRSDATAPYINVKGPLQRLDDPAPADVDSVPWPDPEDPANIAGLRERLARLRRETDYALVLRVRNCGTLYLAQRLRGFAEFLEDMLAHPAFVHAIQERATDLVCRFAEFALREVGDLVDGVSFGDDLGTQIQPLMRPETYRSMVKPYHARFVETLHRHTDAKVILHSCGAISPLLGDLIDCGVDVINPVQVNATGMAPARLKEEFGKDICFWGGIDTQRILPTGSADEVAAEVRARRGDLGRGGGWVLAAVHNIRAEVPPENIVAMYDAARETAGQGVA